MLEKTGKESPEIYIKDLENYKEFNVYIRQMVERVYSELGLIYKYI